MHVIAARQAQHLVSWPARLRRCLTAGVTLLMSACGTVRPDGDSAATTAASLLGREVNARWVSDIDALLGDVGALDSALVMSVRDSSAAAARLAQARFTAARLAYKRVEFLATYYEPSTSDAINGPALPHVDDEEGPEAVMPPEGFQVVEELLFPVADRSALPDAINETRNLYAYIRRLRTAASGQRLTDDRIWDAAKLQLARIVSLGITGFDSPVALQSVPEAAAALRGMRNALSVYRTALGGRGWATLAASFETAISELDRSPAFAEFDRLAFITQSANPLARALDDARVALRIVVTNDRRAFRTEAASLFDAGAFDVYAFAAPQTMPATAEQVALGRALFFEPRLSGDAAVACATCHDPARAFTDGRERSVSRSGTASLRNAPTIINAGLQVGSFYDLRTTYLEDQVSDVVRNDEEMHGSVEQAAARFRRDAQYRVRFASAFPRSADSAVSGPNVRIAIAAYLRSLTALDSRVDRALRGDTTAIDAEERHGLNLFLGKARCGTCHFAPLFNGTVPPMYQESEVEVIGVPARRATRNARIDPDSGRMRVTRSVPHRYAFKTPSVRNAALTAPYMHNGAYPTLASVVDFYNRGGGVGIGIRLENQTLPADTLGLTTVEQRAVVRFMEALTDTAHVTSSPEAIAYRQSVVKRALAGR